MTVGRNFVKEVLIQDVEKRRQPTKHYVYRIRVSWSDGKIHVIYRRYSQFFSLQDSIINLYPGESGASDPARRIIPLLPGKILFGRSQIREVALRRKDLINEYLQLLVKLPEHIAKSDLVISFLTVTQDDVTESSRGNENEGGAVKSAENISEPILLEQYIVVANFEKNDRNQVSLACGDTVEVIEKHDNGWWFVSIEDEHGWAPSSYLEPVDGNREDEREVVVEEVEKFICITDYNAEQHDELSLKLGDIVSVKIKQRDGWWTVKLHTESGVLKEEGIVPAAHLKKFQKPCCCGDKKDVKYLPNAKNIKAPPRQNTVKKAKRPKPQRPKPVQGIRNQAMGSDDNVEEEEVVYVCAVDYHEVDSGGTYLDIKKGTELTVLEKTPNGWWKVKADGQEGWVPSSVAQRKRRLKSDKITQSDKNTDETKELYSTISSYVSKEQAGLSFEPDEVVEVLDKDPNGWWFVKIGEREGWAPSNYLKKYEPKRTNINTLHNIKIGVLTDNDCYENVVTANLPSSIQPPSNPQFTAKPPIAAKPSVPPKPSLVPPKPAPRSASCNQVDQIANKRGGVKQKHGVPKPGRPDLPTGYDPVRTKACSVSSYTNLNTSFNASKDNQGSRGDIYVAMADYKDTDDDDMLSFKAGQLLLVTKKEDNGWWFAEVGDQGGWVPSNYLKEN